MIHHQKDSTVWTSRLLNSFFDHHHHLSLGVCVSLDKKSMDIDPHHPHDHFNGAHG